MSELNNENTKIIKDENDEITSGNKFAEFGDITHDVPGRDYGSYKWDNENKKWITQKFE